jgi:F-type H+-transporting ATPase subunit b
LRWQLGLEVGSLVFLGLAGNAIQLVPDGTLLLHLALIAVMVALLNVTLLKPINRILEKRERRTKGRFAEAQSILASLSERLLEYEARLREARAEGYVLLEEERAAVSRERERKVAEIKVEVTTLLHEQKEKLRIDAEQIRATLEKDAKAMALEIARQILRREVNQ